MIRKLVASGLIAGVVAGGIAALLQLWLVVPVLLEAETYESGAAVHFSTSAGHLAAGFGEDVLRGHGDETHAASAHAAPESLLRRHVTTFFATQISFTGFALLMVAGFALATRAGHVVTPRLGLLWGLVGFAAFHLAPAAGLPPEVPGVAAADLFQRQLWWIGAAACTVLALALFVFGRSPVAIGAGLVLLFLPHVIGAPEPDGYAGSAPPELAALFAARALFAGALAWSTLGLVAGYLWSRDATA